MGYRQVRSRYLSKRLGYVVVVACTLAQCIGCYAPMRSTATPATLLPDHFRTPVRTAGTPLNFAALTRPPAEQFLLGPDDVLDVTIPNLFQDSPNTPMRVRVMPDGCVSLPLVGNVPVAGHSVHQAQRIIEQHYAQGYLVKPRVILFLAEKATIRVVVLGKVSQ